MLGHKQLILTLKPNNMKTALQLLFLALLFLPNSSCLNKDPLFEGDCTSGCIVFLGSVTDPNGEAVESEIEINYRETGIFSFERLIGETETDKDGNFAFSFDGTNYKIDEGTFKVSAHKGGYISDDREGLVSFSNIDSTRFDLPNIANVAISPISRIELDVKVDSPSEITSFIYRFSYLNRSIFVSVPDGTLSNSQNYDQIVGGNQTVLFRYSYKKLGTLLEFEESFYMEGGQTKKVEIEID